jgi:hypothetical protein
MTTQAALLRARLGDLLKEANEILAIFAAAPWTARKGSVPRKPNDEMAK